MENQQSSIKSTMITYGLILGGISVVFQLMLFFLDMHYQQPPAVGIVSIVIMIGLLVYAFIQYKKENEGFLSLSEALKIGLGISLISAIVGIVYSIVLTEVLDPATMQKTLDFQFETMRAENPEMTQDQIEHGSRYVSKILRSSNPFCFSTYRCTFLWFYYLINWWTNRKEIKTRISQIS
jgi:amino acid transporter